MSLNWGAGGLFGDLVPADVNYGDGTSSVTSAIPYRIYGYYLQKSNLIGGGIDAGESAYIAEQLNERTTAIRIIGDVFYRCSATGFGGVERVFIAHCGLLRQPLADNYTAAQLAPADRGNLEVDWIALDRRIDVGPTSDELATAEFPQGIGRFHFDTKVSRRIESNEAILLYIQFETFDGNPWTGGPALPIFTTKFAFRILHTE